MKILGVGPLEVIVVLVFAILVLGPDGMIKAGRELGKFLGRIRSSELWRAIKGSGNLWDELIDDLGLKADLESFQSDLSGSTLPRLDDLDKYKARFSEHQSKTDHSRPRLGPEDAVDGRDAPQAEADQASRGRDDHHQDGGENS